MTDMQKREPYTMWAATAPFRKTGTPVLGTMGASTQRVVIMTVETFGRLVRENPNLATAQLNVGEMDG